MIERVKKGLAVAALACMALFVGAVLVLTLTGEMQQNQAWIYAPLTGFLLLGLTCIGIKKLQERARRQAEAEQACEDDAQEK